MRLILQNKMFNVRWSFVKSDEECINQYERELSLKQWTSSFKISAATKCWNNVYPSSQSFWVIMCVAVLFRVGQTFYSQNVIFDQP